MRTKYIKVQGLLSLNSISNIILFSFVSLLTIVVGLKQANAQSPGGVSGSLKAWYKADNGILSGDSTTVSTWTSSNTAAYSVTQGTVSSQPILYTTKLSKLVNYNPALDFDGTDDLQNATRLYSNTDNFQLFTVGKDLRTSFLLQRRATLGIGSDGNYPSLDLNTDILSPNGWSPGMLLLSLPLTWDGGAALLYNGNTGGSNQQPQIFGLGATNAFLGFDNIESNVDGFIQATPLDAGQQIEIGNGVYVGSSGGEQWIGLIPEVIIYNRKLSATEVQHVNSYLSIKYGITMQNTASNYLSSDGTVLWNAAANTGYYNNIAIIGRDDNSALQQKQSKSVNEGFQPVISLGALTATNVSNTSVFSADHNYEAIGSDAGSTNFTTTYTPAFVPNGTFLRMARVWKVQETGTVGIVRISVPVGHADYLLVSNTSFPGTGATEIALMPDGNGNIYADVDFSNGQFFTFGKDFSAPGNVVANLQLWLRADQGTSTTVNGAALTQWDDQTPNVRDHIQTVSANQPSFVGNSYNYNPAVNFDGDDAMITDAFVSGDEAIHVFTMSKVDDNGWHVVYGFGRDVTHIQWYNNGFATRPSVWLFPLLNQIPSTALGIDYGIATYLLPKDGSQKSIIWNGTSANIGILNNYLYNTGKMAVGSDIDNSGGGIGLLSESFLGNIQEVIVYKTGTPTTSGGPMSTTDIQKIESYLAVKYGVTLAHNYFSGTGAIIYDTTNYANNIFGIGREDAQALQQKQSTSINSTSILVIGVDTTIASTNASNIGSFDNNGAYLVMGDNGDTGWTADSLPASFCYSPSGINNIFNKKWKVQETDSVEMIKIQVPTSIFTGNINITDFPIYLVVADDAGLTTNRALVQGNVVGSNVIFKYNFPSNSIRYFTFAGSDADSLCNNDKIFEWNTPGLWSNGVKIKTIISSDQTFDVDIADQNNNLFNWSPYGSSWNDHIYLERRDNNSTAGTITTKFAMSVPAAGASFQIFDIDEFVKGKDKVTVFGKLGSATVDPSFSLPNPTALTISVNTVSATTSAWDLSDRAKVYVTFKEPVDTIVIQYNKQNTYNYNVYNDIRIRNIDVQCQKPFPAQILPDNVYVYKEVVNGASQKVDEPFAYKFTLQNFNCDTLLVDFDDVLPGGLTWEDNSLATSLSYNSVNGYGGTNTLSLSAVSLMPGESYLYVSAIGQTPGVYDNQATYVVNGNTYRSDDPNISGSSDTTSVTLIANLPLANLLFSQVVDLDTAYHNDTVTYTYSITNPNAFPVSVNFIDNLQGSAGGILTYIAGSLSGATGATIDAYANTSTLHITNLIIPSSGILLFSVKANINTYSANDTVFNFATITPDPASGLREVPQNTDTVITKILCDTTYTVIDTTICLGSAIVINSNVYMPLADTIIIDSLLTISGCDSIVTTNIILSLNSVYHITQDTAICLGSNIMLDNILYTPLSDTIVVLNLTSVTGCDSIVTTNITVNPSYNITLDTIICSGSGIVLDSILYIPLTDTIVVLNLISITGCDSIVTVNIDLNPVYNIVQNVSTCLGSGITLSSILFTPLTDTTVIFNLTSITGCDSIVTTNIRVTPTYNITQNIPICLGSIFSLGSILFTPLADTTIVLNLLSVTGCDSIVTINITVGLTYNITQNTTICPGSGVVVRGTLYTPLTDTTIALNLLGFLVCDTTLTVNVTVAPVSNITRDTTICSGSGITLNSILYLPLTDTLISLNLLSVNGCDSIVNYNVTVAPVSNITRDTTICSGSGITLNSILYLPLTDTLISLNLLSVNGCDSIVNYNVTVAPVSNITRDTTICAGSGITLNSILYLPLTDTLISLNLLSVNGCDSIINYNVTVAPVSNITRDTTICAGSGITLNSILYLPLTDTLISLNLLSVNGCDSIVNYNVTVAPVSNITRDTTICSGSGITLNSILYLPLTDTLISLNLLSVNGCDSIVNYNVTVAPVSNITRDTTICSGSGITLNSILYLPLTDTLISLNLLSVNGCDSIVNYNVTVAPVSNITRDTTICSGSGITLNSILYLPLTDTLISLNLLSVNGCDSIVNYNVTVAPVSNITRDTTICSGSGITLNSILYLPLTDTLISLNLLSVNGCDSIVNYNVTVAPVSNITRDTTICAGSGITLNSILYLPLTDTLISLNLLSVNGCDSIVNYNVTVAPVSNITRDTTICSGSGITLNSILYLPLTDTLISLNLLSVNGCDSIVNYNVTVAPVSNITRDTTICSGSGITLNSILYLPLTDTLISLNLLSVNGCDSIVNYNVTVAPVSNITRDTTICAGSGITLNSILYLPLTDTLISLNLLSVNGCDSIINYNVTVAPVSNITRDTTICAGSGITLNSILYLPLTDTLISLNLLSVNGCDSIVNYNVTVAPVSNITRDTTICSGSGITLNSILYLPLTDTLISLNLLSVNGCDSIVNYNVTVAPVSNITRDTTICSGSGITLNSILYLPLTDTLISLNLLSVNGCDSIVNYNVTVAPVSNITRDTTICSGSGITLNSILYLPLTDTLISLNLLSVNGCDSIVNYNVTVAPVSNITRDTTICSGSGITLNSILYLPLTDTLISLNLLSVNGCDSIVNYNVTVTPVSNITRDTAICAGSSIVMNSVQYTPIADTVIMVNLPGTLACDTLLTVNVTVNPIYNITRDTTICLGNSVVIGSNTYVPTADTIVIANVVTTTGCDSIVITNIKVNPTYNIMQNVFACSGSGILLNNVLYTPLADTTVILNLTSIMGCDSIVTVNITVTSVYAITQDTTICAGSSIVMNSVQYTPIADTVIVVNLLGTLGCDTILTVNISVGSSYTIMRDTAICSGSSIIINGNTYTPITDTTVVYNLMTVAGCDSIVSTNINILQTSSSIVNTRSCNQLDTGTIVTILTGSNGCDSIVTTITTLKPISICNDDVILPPLPCDTCTMQICLDTIYRVTGGIWTSCSGTITTTGLGVYSMDSGGCVTYTGIGIVGYDTLCVILCDMNGNNCDTLHPVLPILPTTDTIRLRLPLDSTVTVCVPIEMGMNSDSVSVASCSGVIDNTTSTYAVNGNCVNVTITATDIGGDVICVIICDDILGICDTNRVIVIVTPPDHVILPPLPCDTCTMQVCLDTIYHVTGGVWTSCSGTTTTTDLGIYSIDSAGCVTYTGIGIIGYDTLCVVLCDTSGNHCDTLHPIVPIYPSPDTLILNLLLDSTVTRCIPIPTGMNASSVSVAACHGVNNNVTMTYTISGSCMNVTLRGTNVGTDTICVIICDNILNICDTNRIMVSVISLCSGNLIVQSVSSNAPVCEHQTINLFSVIQAPGGYVYVWTGPDNFTSADANPVIPDAQLGRHNGFYTLIIRDSNNCVSAPLATFVEVNKYPDNVSASSNTPVCAGSAIGLSASNIFGASYAWTGPDGFTSSLRNPVILNATVQNAGVYSVIISLGNCESTVTETNVAVTPNAVANAGPDTAVYQNQPIMLNASGGTNYIWTPYENLNNNTIASPIFIATEIGEYTLVVTTQGEGTCSAKDTLVITVLPLQNLQIPDVITPNNDGVNDVWVIKFLENITESYVINVYARAGALVMSTKAYNQDWAGTYNHKDLPDGTYWYILELESGTLFKGTLTIKR